MRPVLFIENHDSFSWNVIDALPFDRRDVRVVHAAEAHRSLREVQAVVMGPGPTDPFRAGLVDLIQHVAELKLPFLGICLGHQALGLAFGARLLRSVPTHGKRARLIWPKHRLFPGIEGPYEVMRYHSLSLSEVASPLHTLAQLEDGTVMAVAHDVLPMAGLQFHPDSFGTPQGRAMLAAFFRRPEINTPSPIKRHRPRATSTETVETIRLSSLRERHDFALLAPAYGDGSHWTLLDNLSTSPSGTTVLWYAAAETPGDQAQQLWGTAHAITLIVDEAPLKLQVQLHDTGFREGVDAIRNAIAAGDVYQVNLTVRAHFACESGASLLSTLCQRETPRFAAWVKSSHIGEFVSASPELLFETADQWVHAEPMKGTAPPSDRARLLASEKDGAELAMITDLLRDDLHQVCLPGSVQVTHERRIIELPYALQTVADVEGERPPGQPLRDVLQQLHPGGSVTGAPRAAALDLIQALEPTPRGAYCGTLGLEKGASARFALLIRTAQRDAKNNWVYGVGGGITWDSDAAQELDEVRLKLEALGAR